MGLASPILFQVKQLLSYLVPDLQLLFCQPLFQNSIFLSSAFQLQRIVRSSDQLKDRIRQTCYTNFGSNRLDKHFVSLV